MWSVIIIEKGMKAVHGTDLLKLKSLMNSVNNRISKRLQAKQNFAGQSELLQH